MLASIARIAFVPLFLYCNTRARRNVDQFKFPDAIYFCILLAFGLSNGFVKPWSLLTTAQSRHCA